jgi:L-asparaginase II
MTRLTKDQIAFAQSMTIKQRRVLRTLAMWPWYMSASERADPELYELFRNRLVRSSHHAAGAGGFLSWGVTEAGKRIAERMEKGSL